MKFLSRFRKSEDGVSAIEFAFILPVMVVMFLGVVEVSNYVMAARRVASIASTAADLVAQDSYIGNDEMGDIMGALNGVLAPLNPANATFVITSVVMEADGTKRVAWSDATNTTPRTAGSVVSDAEFPDDLIQPFQGAIMTEIEFGYDPMFADFLSRTDIQDTFYMKPRRSLTIQRGN